MDDALPPRLGNTGNVRQEVLDAGGEEKPPRRERRSVRQPDADGVLAGLGVRGLGLHEAGAVGFCLRATDSTELVGRCALPGEDVVATGRGRVTARSSVDHDDGSSGTGKNQGGGESGRPGPRDEDIRGDRGASAEGHGSGPTREVDVLLMIRISQ